MLPNTIARRRFLICSSALASVSGLGYQTIDYDTLSSQNLPATRFSGLFFHALWKEYLLQQAPDRPAATSDTAK